MTEYVYKLKNGKVISAYEDEKGNISITKEALEIMGNSWDAGYQKGYSDGCLEGRADAEEDAYNRMNMILDDEKRLSYDCGYQQGRADDIDEFETYAQKWADRQECIGRKVVKLVVNELIDSAKQLRSKTMNGYYNRPCLYSETDPCLVNCKKTNCPYYIEDEEKDEEE